MNDSVSGLSKVPEYCGLKVLHVANLPLLPKGAGYHGVAFKLSNGLTRIGCQVLNYSDRAEARASTIFRTRRFGAQKSNKKLIKVVQEFRPDIILFGHADTIFPDTLSHIRAALPDVMIAQWNVDPLFEDVNVSHINKKIAYVDYTFVSTAGKALQALSADKWNVSFLPNPVDFSIESTQCFRKSKQDLNNDLFCAIGNENDVRQHGDVTDIVSNIIQRIKDKCPNVRFSTPGCHGQPNAYGVAYEENLFSSAMGLNLSRQNSYYLYSSDRYAQMTGAGELVFVDRATGYTDLFDEDCFGFYSTEAELLDKINYFSTHDIERQLVAKRGWEQYTRLFNVESIATYMLDVITGKIPPRVFEWPTA